MVALLFSCEGTETTYTIGVNGDLYPGSSLSLVVRDDAGEVVMTLPWIFTVTSEKNIARVQGGKLILSEDAEIGDEFVLSVSAGKISLSATFSVQAPPVTHLSVVCADEAAAGDVLPLSVKILPVMYKGADVTYSVTGKAAVSDGTLVIGQDADRSDVITVSASYRGFVSAKKRVVITTYQPKKITIESEIEACLPGETLSVTATVAPSYVDYSLEYELEEGAAYARYDETLGKIFVSEDAPMGGTIVFKAICNTLIKRETFRVGHPTATGIAAESGGSAVACGETKSFDFTLSPANADKSLVEIILNERSSRYVEWNGGTEFTVLSSTPEGAEIAFILRYSEEVQTVVAYTVESRNATSLSVMTSVGTDSYLASGESATFTSYVEPLNWAGDVYYDVLEGEDLVEQTASGVFTVKEGAGRGVVRVQARTSDGIYSEEKSFTVRGRYVRVACTTWDDISFTGRPAAIWFVLPKAAHTADRTVIVPRETVDIVLEGHYDGTTATAYKGLYFYFRNAATDRTVTLSNFATIADYGLGGIVMEFGSEGKTNVVLEGENAVWADTPRYVDNTGEKMDGVWRKVASPSAQTIAWRNGKDGYNGANGGTAMSGSELVFKGEGSLELRAGDGTDGTTGGRGANAEYVANMLIYVAGNGGAGGNGGDSGVAIRANKVTFESGFVNAIAGNAGKGYAGAAAGNVDALDGYSVTAEAGKKGADGRDGVCYPAVYATTIEGEADRYSSTTGVVKSVTEKSTESLKLLSAKLATFYGINLVYGADVTYRNLTKHSGYKMTRQTDDEYSMQQMQMLQYTFSMMPKNCWREFGEIIGKISVYLVKSINDGNTLGLTDSSNNVWFATFDTEVRGIIRGGYYNIMIHEFTHVCHYNMREISSARTDAFEKALKGYNYGLDYGKTSNERVYGMEDEAGNSAENCCFLSRYSRTNSHEDAAETMSISAIFTVCPDFLKKGTTVRSKFQLIANVFASTFETLTSLTTPNLFAYDHLFDEE